MNKTLPARDTAAGHKYEGRAEPAAKISNILPLTNMQKAFWLHCNHADVVDSGLVQAQMRLTGQVHQDMFEKAWQLTLMEFELLRTSVNVNATGEPFMVCREQVKSDVEHLDFSKLPVADQCAAIIKFNHEDRTRGLDLTKVPNTRLTLISLSDSEWVLVWTSHHLLLDGWSGITVINRLFAHYSQLQNGQDVEFNERLPYSRYRCWLTQRDMSADKRFWENELSGFTSPTLLCDPLTRMRDLERSSLCYQLLDTEESQELTRYCQKNRVTSATVAQAVWALVLGNVCNADEVATGISTTGRSGKLDYIDTTVGPLSTIIPLRIRLDETLTVSQWLSSVQQSQFTARQHDCLSLAEILLLAEPSCRHTAFDSLLIIENLPSLDIETIPSLTVSDYRSDVASGYPITITLIPGTQWNIQCDFQPQRIPLESISALLNTFKSTLTSLLNHENGSVGDLSAFVKSIAPAHPNPQALLIQSTRHIVRGDQFEALSMPCNHTELELLALWEEILHRQPLSMDSDFFELGGTSLAAVNLVSMIELRLSVRISVAKILTAATPRLMAAELDQNSTDKQGLPCVIPLQGKGDEPALFCVHGAGGHALMYREFAARLGESRPIYGIQPRGLDGFDEPIDNSIDMARHYVDEMTAIQSTGPYHLLFYCYGGGLMLEMAHLIKQRGLQLGHLIMIDTVTPIPANHPMSRLGWKAYLTYEAVVRMKWSYLRKAVRKSTSRQMNSLMRINLPGGQVSKTMEKSDIEMPHHLLRVQQACQKAFTSYRAHRSNLSLHVITSRQYSETDDMSVIYDNWDAICPNVQKHVLNLSHSMIFIEPQTAITSQTVKDILSAPC